MDSSVVFLGQTVSRGRVLDALTQFHRKYPDTNAYRSWLDDGKYLYAILYRGNLYAPKRILAMARGVPVTRFGGGEQTNSVLRRLGFEVIDKP